MKVIVCGSRVKADSARITQALKDADAHMVITGAAPGVDTVAHIIAVDHGMATRQHRADWGTWGKAAGPIRNQRMLDAHPDAIVLAFPHGESKGTRDMIRRARQQGREVRVFESYDEATA